MTKLWSIEELGAWVEVFLDRENGLAFKGEKPTDQEMEARIARLEAEMGIESDAFVALIHKLSSAGMDELVALGATPYQIVSTMVSAAMRMGFALCDEVRMRQVSELPPLGEPIDVLKEGDAA